MRWTVIIALSSCLTGCATTNRGKTLVLMGGAAAAGGGIGYAMAPRDERAEMHAVYGAALGAALAGVASLFLFDEQQRSEELERQAIVMRKELDAFRDEGGGHEPRLLYETTAPFGKDIPGEYQSLIKPGRWSVYKLNQWVNQGEGTLVHQDRMVKLVPPQLTPKAQPLSNEGVGPSEADAPPKAATSNQTDKSKGEPQS